MLNLSFLLLHPHSSFFCSHFTPTRSLARSPIMLLHDYRSWTWKSVFFLIFFFSSFNHLLALDDKISLRRILYFRSFFPLWAHPFFRSALFLSASLATHVCSLTWVCAGGEEMMLMAMLSKCDVRLRLVTTSRSLSQSFFCFHVLLPRVFYLLNEPSQKSRFFLFSIK